MSGSESNERPARPAELGAGPSSASSIDYDEAWMSVYGDMQEHGPVHRHLARLVARLLQSIEYHSVLDVGCGPGCNHALLTSGRDVGSYAGIDVSERAVARARQQLAGEFWVADIEKERLSGRWDLVYCSLVLEHLDDDVAALRHMRAVTGKYLIVSTIAGDYESYRPWEERMGHVRNYRRGELEEKLDRVGFNPRRVVYWGFPLYSPLARKLQNRSRIGSGNFGRVARIAASALYLTYFLNSDSRGDLAIALATPD